MINRRTILEILDLKDQGHSLRSIAGTLQLDRGTVAKYLQNEPAKPSKRSPKVSKLDPYREMIVAMVEEYPNIKAPLVLRQIQEKGFDGEITIVRDLLRKIRGKHAKRRAYIRFESSPGEQVQVDWAHFPALEYEGIRRKLYALAVVEGYSRMLYVHFFHSQQQACLHQGLLEAFRYFGGTAKEIVVDNMLTAVTERVGKIIRFNEAFLEFIGNFGIRPHACTVRAPYEKGKVENSIKYLRSSFWPLRKFTDLDDAQRQVREWLDTVANVRVHCTTGHRPVDRLHGLQPLPSTLPDCRQVISAQVHKDFGVRFDTNVYSVPPWAVGKQVVLKADNSMLNIFFKNKLIACHKRCWQRRQRLEQPGHHEQVKRIKQRILRDRQLIVFLSLGEIALDYVEQLNSQRLPIKKNITALLGLQDEYGEKALLQGLQQSLDKKVVGAEYVQNILYQKHRPINTHLPVRLKQEELNNIRLALPALAEYDAIALKKRSGND